MSTTELTRGVKVGNERWRHLILSIICMILIANLQYGWSVFVQPLQKANGWSVAAIQVAFTLFVALETWGTPINAWVSDRLGVRKGPRTVMGFGGAIILVGWVINAYAQSLGMLYLGNILTGIGAGGVYCVCVGTAVKWFPDRRGLASGLVAAGFGAGAALTILPIKAVIATHGYPAAFMWFGIGQGGLVLILSQFVRHPEPDEAPPAVSKRVQQSSHSYTSKEMLASPVFWILYICDVLMCAGGLVVTASLVQIANSHNITNEIVMGATALSMALVLSNVMNGIGRPIFGAIADKLGVPVTMVLGFGLGAIAYYSMYAFGANPTAFVFGVSVVFLAYGNIFSLFPTMNTNIFGAKYATTNSSLLYTAKGVAGLLVPIAAIVAKSTGNWDNVLLISVAINVISIFIVWFVLRPAASRFIKGDAKAA